MRPETRRKFDAYTARIAELNGVKDPTKKFTATPSVQQALENKMQENSEFLTKINLVMVQEKDGEKLGLGVGGPIASTTDTATTDRTTSDPTTLDTDGYGCAKIDFNTHITYAKLDLWAKFADFQTRIRDAILKRQALDRIMIGFNGASRAATSNKTNNPLLQDVGVGWLQKYRANAAARVMGLRTQGSPNTVVKVGTATGKDYVNLDALVFDAVNELIDPWYQENTDLVVICGRALLADKYFPILNKDNAPTEQIAADLIISQKRIGNLPAARVPSFPPNALMITSYDNLSIYTQESSRRRTIVDNAKRDRIENYESDNEDFVVEDYGKGCLVENIVYTW